MAGLPVSFGDIVALGTLLFRTYNKCKKVSSEYQDLANIIESAQLCVESTRYSVENIYQSLPAIHKASLGKAVAGVRDVAVAISDDLNLYSAIRPGAKFQISKLKFAILQNPREAESRLTT